jgi:hypothetical protein
LQYHLLEQCLTTIGIGLATGHPTKKRPRVARAGEATPAGFKRVPFSAVLED